MINEFNKLFNGKRDVQEEKKVEEEVTEEEEKTVPEEVVNSEVSIATEESANVKNVEYLKSNNIDVDHGLELLGDIDLYNGNLGIELKLAKELLKSATNIERLFGQAIYYNHRCYNGNLIILVVGRKKDCTPQMREIKSLIEELGVKFVFNCID